MDCVLALLRSFNNFEGNHGMNWLKKKKKEYLKSRFDKD